MNIIEKIDKEFDKIEVNVQASNGTQEVVARVVRSAWEQIEPQVKSAYKQFLFQAIQRVLDDLRYTPPLQGETYYATPVKHYDTLLKQLEDITSKIERMGLINIKNKLRANRLCQPVITNEEYSRIIKEAFPLTQYSHKEFTTDTFHVGQLRQWLNETDIKPITNKHIIHWLKKDD